MPAKRKRKRDGRTFCQYTIELPSALHPRLKQLARGAGESIRRTIAKLVEKELA